MLRVHDVTAADPTATRPTATTPPPVAHWPGRELLDDALTARVLHAVWSGDPATLVPSPPGAGKTRLVTLLAVALAEKAGLHVGIAAQTKDQAIDIATRLAPLTSNAVLNWSTSSRTRPTVGSTRVASRTNRATFPDNGGGIVIATTAKWVYCDPATLACDVMIVDEGWQATHAAVGALGAFTGQIVAVGDPGQIAPVVTGSVQRWASSPTGPHLPAPAALTAAHRDHVTTIRMKHSWRLGPATTDLISPIFYPHLPFTSKRPHEHITTATGTVFPELSIDHVTTTAGPGDPALFHACADHALTFLDGTYTTTTGTRPMLPSDIAVVTPHVNQSAAIRAILADHPDILVGTANQLQGLERPAVVALHPLSGYRDYEQNTFGLNTGRMCVELTRHRSALMCVADSQISHGLAHTPDNLPGVREHQQILTYLTTHQPFYRDTQTTGDAPLLTTQPHQNGRHPHGSPHPRRH